MIVRLTGDVVRFTEYSPYMLADDIKRQTANVKFTYRMNTYNVHSAVDIGMFVFYTIDKTSKFLHTSWRFEARMKKARMLSFLKVAE